jgi:dTDP-4-amino-4,6-dideoxygalactose transaminase
VIPRFRPELRPSDFSSAIFARGGVEDFERLFAKTFEATHAISFPYGRSAFWALLGALGIRDSEVIIPAYTCAVVAHAVVLSGNTPRFVDISPVDYNMRVDLVARTLTPRTRMVLATHLFGFPMDVAALRAVIRQAEQRWGIKIHIIHDCAHSFGARWQGRLVAAEDEAALFGLNISKMITSIFGGMITTSDDGLAKDLRTFRRLHFAPPSPLRAATRFAYLTGAFIAFSRPVYPLTNWLAEQTPLLHRLTKAYHLDGKIHFPPDARTRMTDLEARVGASQLRPYEAFVERRQALARMYTEGLSGERRIRVPPFQAGATYSHFPVWVEDRATAMAAMARQGIQLGSIVDYAIPEFAAYRRYVGNEQFPVASSSARHVVNLPMSTTFNDQIIQHIIRAFRQHLATPASTLEDIA